VKLYKIGLNTVFVSFLAALLAGCSASVTSSDGPFAPDNRVLRESSAPLAGAVDQADWSAGKAIALRQPSGEYDIVIAGKGKDLTCLNFFPLSPHLSFVVPATLGTYRYDSADLKGGRIVNVIFPAPVIGGSGGSDNVLASKSMIAIDSIFNGTLSGRVAALSPNGASHAYDLSGAFSAEICRTLAETPVAVKIQGSPAFP